ncbi:MAG: DUF6240 domain-containing protein [Lachnospiraceae bacterium]
MVINAANLTKTEQTQAGYTDAFEAVGMSEDTKKKEKAGMRSVDVHLSQTKKETQEPVYQKPQKEQTPVQDSIQNTFDGMDATQRKEQMVMLSNTMTAEDYKKAQEDGFSPADTDSATIVTEMDKIKMTLAESGKDISCFGDTPDIETVQAYTGDVAFAEQVARAMQQADVPVTQENVTDLAQTVEQVESLKPLDSDGVKYLLQTQKAPTVENLYVAEHCSSASLQSVAPDAADYAQLQRQAIQNYTAQNQTGSTFSEQSVSDAVGQKARGLSVETDRGLQQQMQQVIEQAGLPVNTDTMKTAEWMMQEEIPLTEENLNYAMDLQNLTLPPAQEEVVQAAVSAISEGEKAGNALLIASYRSMEKAEQAEQTILEAKSEDVLTLLEDQQPITIQTLRQMQNQRKKEQDSPQKDQNPQAQMQSEIKHVTVAEFTMAKAQRTLAEAQLLLTASSAYQLIKQGIDIDVKPLEELVEQLKDVEDQYYRQLLAENNVEPTKENTAIFRETTESIEQIKELPAYTLGRMKVWEDQPDYKPLEKQAEQMPTEDTLKGVLKVGKELQAEMEKANQRYETMQTQVRPDLGDSMKKAFSNVDEILSDYGMKPTEDNARAVRILAYNQLEITPESITQMKAADQQVQKTFDHMKPSVVLAMIRKGIHPLDMNIQKLNETAEAILQEQGDDGTESFSKFLYQVEKKHDITKEERDAYIGMYRLIHQVEKTDSAAVGAVLHQGRDMTMRNLLTVVRSQKKSGKSYAIDDETELKTGTGTIENSITEQMERVYQLDCLHQVKEVLTPQKAQLLQEQEWMSMTPEELKEFLGELPRQEEEQVQEETYFKEQLARFEEAAKAPRQVYELLEQFKLPNTVGTILAMRQMTSGKRNVFSQLFDALPDGEELDVENLKQQTLEKFAEAVKTPEELAEAEKELAETAEHAMQTMLSSDVEVTSLNLNQLQMASAQMEIVTHMVKDEQYAIPVLVGGELTDVSLKIVRGKEEKGKLEVFFDSPQLGKVAMQMKVSEKKVDGLITAEDEKTLQLLVEQREKLQQQLGSDRDCELRFVSSKPGTLSWVSRSQADSPQTEESGIREIQTQELYGMSSRLLKGLGEIRRADD